MTENQGLAKTSGPALIFDNEDDEKIRHDPVAVCVVMLVNAMKADFGHKFQSQFADANAVRMYKRRLWKKINGMNLAVVFDAYELFVDSNPRPEWPPTVPQLLGMVEELEKSLKKTAENRAESQALTRLPAPTIQCNPLAMLAEAKASAGKHSREEILQNHNAVLVLYGNKIRRGNHGQRPCNVPGCGKQGVISASTKGDGNFYCGEHYQDAA